MDLDSVATVPPLNLEVMVATVIDKHQERRQER